MFMLTNTPKVQFLINKNMSTKIIIYVHIYIYINKSWSSTKPGKIITYSAQNVIIGADSSLSIVQVWAVSAQ